MDIFNYLRSLHIFSWKILLLVFLPALILSILIWYLIPEIIQYTYHIEKNFIPEELDFVAQLLILGVIFKLLFNFPLKEVFNFFKRNIKGYQITFNQRSAERFKQEWEIQGNPIITAKGLLLVTNTNSGILIKPTKYWWERLWKDFEATIELSFINQNRKINREWLVDNGGNFIQIDKTRTYKKLLGITFRAQDFENYFLIEVWNIDNYLLIRPHVRIDGNWDAPVLNPSANSVLARQNNLKIKLKVKNDQATLFIGKYYKEKLEWILPSHYETNLIQNVKSLSDDLKTANVREISFRNKRGRFGFRNYGDESAIVHKLTIRPL